MSSRTVEDCYRKKKFKVSSIKSNINTDSPIVQPSQAKDQVEFFYNKEFYSVKSNIKDVDANEHVETLLTDGSIYLDGISTLQNELILKIGILKQHLYVASQMLLTADQSD